jgi:nitroimidazol reductase NimA-like FMN-containing flavoprotein (pyridoxamine 5'-phosphate oxidase superfamily)
MPIAEELVMPAGYGETTATQPWGQVSARLGTAKQYWLATNRSAGSPHSVPVDGIWLDDVLYYGGSPDTLHVRAAKADPHVTIHLPDPWNVVVVEGIVRLAKPSAQLAQHLADLANEKYVEYGMHFEASSYSDPFVLQPRRAFAWSSFPADATRYVFDA